MENIDLLVLRTLRDWRAAGRRALLATVTHTWGSSPRPVGSLMALREDGHTVGSVSGGCIEDDLIHRFSTAFDGQGMPESAPQRVRYGVSADEAHRFGLPCGGTLELQLEFDPEADALSELVNRLDAGELVRRTLDCRSGAISLHTASAPEALQCDENQLSAIFGPGWRMLLIGAGALAEYLASMALFNGFRVTLCDPRMQYMGSSQLAGIELDTRMPDDAVVAFRPDARSAVIALSHDPKLDDLALLAALDSPAFYIGAIGSRRNCASRRARMIEHFGQTEHTLTRLRAPVGLYIGSKTPAEIAVSIMAELIAVKNGVQLPKEMDVEQGKQGHAAAIQV